MVGERDYSQLNFSELQSELLNIYNSMPEPLDDLSEAEAQTEFNKRYGEKSLLVQKLMPLLEHSHVTKYFFAGLINGLDFFYVMGIHKGDRTNNPFIDTVFELDNRSEGGIFNPVRAKEIEAQSYRVQTKAFLELQFNEEPNVEAMLAGGNMTQAVEAFKGWRDEFIAKYGDEP